MFRIDLDRDVDQETVTRRQRRGIRLVKSWQRSLKSLRPMSGALPCQSIDTATREQIGSVIEHTHDIWSMAISANYTQTPQPQIRT